MAPDNANLIAHALAMLQIATPALLLSYYLVASAVSTFKHTDQCSTSITKRYQKILELGLTAIVVILYILETIIAVKTSEMDDLGNTRQYPIFCLFMVLTWLIFFLGGVDAGESSRRYNLYITWTISFILEVLIMIFWFWSSNRKSLWFFRRIIQLIRLVSILVLIFSTMGRQKVIKTSNITDEEVASLLSGRAEQQLTNSNEDGQNYGSTRHTDQDTELANDGRGKKSQEASKANNSRSDEEEECTGSPIEQIKQNWWQYTGTFKTFTPYVFAAHSVRLKAQYISLLGVLLLVRGLNVLVPLSLGWVINSLADGRNLPIRQILVYLFIGLLNSSIGLNLAERLLWFGIERDCMFRLQKATYDHVMSLSCDFHSSKKSGRLWQLMFRGRSVVGLFQTLGFQLIPMAIDLIVAINVFWLVFDAYVAFIVAVATVLFWWSTKRAMSRKVLLRRDFVKNYEAEWDQMVESSSNWTTVAYFSRFPYEATKYANCVLKSQSTQRKSFFYSYTVEFIRSSILRVALFVACLRVAYTIVNLEQQVGNFAVLITYWSNFTTPLMHLSSSIDEVAKNLVDAEKLRELLDTKPSVQDSEQAVPFELKKGEIVFDNVSFSYDGKRKASDGVNFRIEAGETVALVGETGGGKSTILKLLFRFYDPDHGRILVDGQDIRQVFLESYRKHIGIVPQDPVLFNMSILDNLRYPDLETSVEQVRCVCQAVALHDKIMSFSKGYDQIVGERGVKLSGGELQRVAIARAMLKNPKILLLDEATSNVDTVTEQQIQDSLWKISAKTTTFVIAHRLSTVMKAHKVMVMKDGKIIEAGSHRDLIRMRGGHYRGLWSSQLKVFFGDGRSKSKSRSRSPNTKDDLLIDEFGEHGLLDNMTEHDEVDHRILKNRTRSPAIILTPENEDLQEALPGPADLVGCPTRESSTLISTRGRQAELKSEGPKLGRPSVFNAPWLLRTNLEPQDPRLSHRRFSSPDFVTAGPMDSEIARHLSKGGRDNHGAGRWGQNPQVYQTSSAGEKSNTEWMEVETGDTVAPTDATPTRLTSPESVSGRSPNNERHCL